MAGKILSKQDRMEIRRDNGTRRIPEPDTKIKGPEYSMSFVCFECKTSNMRHFDAAPCDYPDTICCPVCGELAVNLGRNFKPPKKTDSAQWKKVKFLVDNGFVFQKIRVEPNSYESVPYPETLSDAKLFVVKYRHWAIKRKIK
jgi:hypothetical protein